MAKSARKKSTPIKKPKVRPATPVPQQTTFWERMPLHWKHAVAIGILVVVAVAFFWPVTIGSHSLMGGDIVQWRGMAEAMFQYEEETGTSALWAPNGFSGMPGYHIHYPKEVWQLDRVPATLRAMGMWPVAHFLALLLGTYFLVIYLVKEPLAASLAAVAFGFTTYIPIILTAGHNTKFIALAFAPWLVLAFLFALSHGTGKPWPRTVAAALLFAVALAINLRADHVQITYYVAIALGVVWVVQGVGAFREGLWRQFLIGTGAIAVGGVLGLLMVAHPYMAVAEYAEHTIRGGGGNGLSWEYATRWSQGFGELLTLIVPGAYGGEGATYWGPKPFTAGPHYFGPIVLLLAGMALTGVKRWVVYGLGIAAGLMVLLSLGENFALLKRLMFAVVPFYDAFRVPETWLSVVALFTAVLAGAGLYFLARREPTPDAVERKTRAVYIGLGVLGGLLVILMIGRDVFFSFEGPQEFERLTTIAAEQFERPVNDPVVHAAVDQHLAPIRDERRAMFNRDALRALFLLALGGGIIILQRRRKIPPWALQAGIVLLVVVDLWQVDRRYFNTDHPSVMTPSEVQRAIPEFGFDRYIQAQVAVAGGPGHFRTFPLALNAFNDGRSAYYYESIGGYHGAKLALYQDYIDSLVYRPDGTLNPVGLDLTGTRFIVSRGPIGGMEVAFQDSETGLLVLERSDPMPRAWFVNEVEVLPDDAAVLGRLRRGNVDLRSTALATELPAGLEGRVPEGEQAITLIRHTPREVVWEVQTDRPRLFVASEVYYPAGWVARVGRDEVDIHRVNHLLRGVVVPEGTHLLAMRLEPEVHRQSVMIASISTAAVYLVLLLLLGLMWYRRGGST